jgi:hypothetical protein
VSFNRAMSLAALGLNMEAKKHLYKCDIKLWAKDKLGIHIWSKQEEIAKALVEHKRVAVKSCHGSGKSYFASIVVAWWVDTRHGTGAVVVSTAPSAEQVGKVLWRYIRDHHSKHDLIGRTTLDNEWRDDSGAELAWGRKPADTSTSTFQGIHSSGGVLAVLDEANGIVDNLWTNVYAITTGREDAILAIANPDSPTGEFARIFLKDDPDWYKITISAFDTPNFTDEYLPEEAKGGLISPRWVEARKRSWGEDSPRYRSKVLGEFSTDSNNNLFSLGDVNTGKATECEISTESKPRLGVDVARFGEDYTAVYVYQDGNLRLVEKWSKCDLVTTSERVVEIAIRLGVGEVRIDAVGIGAGVFDMVTRLAVSRWKTIGIVGSAGSPDLDKWANTRAFYFDQMREKMHLGNLDLEFDDEDLQDELLSIEYKFNNRGALQIESKDEMKRRGVKSPDFADAAMYACADLIIDPEDPLAMLKPGDQFEVDHLALLAQAEAEISMY